MIALDFNEYDPVYFNQLCKQYGRVSLEVQSYLEAHKEHPDAQKAQELTNLFLSLLRSQPGATEHFDEG